MTQQVKTLCSYLLNSHQLCKTRRVFKKDKATPQEISKAHEDTKHFE